MPPLERDEVQVWRFDVAQPGAAKDQWLRWSYAVLSAEERTRSEAKRAGQPRDEFVIGRGCLRRLLGAVLGMEPRDIALEVGEHRKPRLASADEGDGLAFNVAHSKGMILIALGWNEELGVDVECVDVLIEVVEVAQTAFSMEDAALVERAGSQEERRQAFYGCWARREAVAKADGRGLLLDRNAFAAGSGAKLEGVGGVTVEDGSVRRAFFVQSLEVGSGYKAAVAWVRANVEIRVHDGLKYPALFSGD